MPKGKKAQWTAGRYSEEVQAVLHVALRQVLILDRETPHEEEKRQIVLVINPSARGIDLSNYTVEELDAFQVIINKAIELARPYCVERDAETAKALASNDVRNKRIWRSPPRYIDFTKEKEHDNQPADNQRLPGGPDEPGDEREHDQSVQG